MQHHHSAPPVQYPVGRSFSQALLLCGAGLLGALVLLAWLAASIQLSWRAGLGAAVCVAAWAMAADEWRNTLAGTLAWDGMNWQLEAKASPAQGFGVSRIAAVSMHVDLQFVVLARLHADLPGRKCNPWIWLERRSAPARWKALRRALLANGVTRSARIGA